MTKVSKNHEGNNANTVLSAVLCPENTKLFKETNPYHPECIGDDNKEKLPYNTFTIVIEDWENGLYRFVNGLHESGSIHNEHFTPNNQKPLKTIGDLNTLWKAIRGKDLTYIGK